MSLGLYIFTYHECVCVRARVRVCVCDLFAHGHVPRSTQLLFPGDVQGVHLVWYDVVFSLLFSLLSFFPSLSLSLHTHTHNTVASWYQFEHLGVVFLVLRVGEAVAGDGNPRALPEIGVLHEHKLSVLHDVWVKRMVRGSLMRRMMRMMVRTMMWMGGD